MLTAEVLLKWSGVPWLGFFTDRQEVQWYQTPEIAFPAINLVRTLDDAARIRREAEPVTSNFDSRFKAVIGNNVLDLEIDTWDLQYRRDNGTITQSAASAKLMTLFEFQRIETWLRVFLTQ